MMMVTLTMTMMTMIVMMVANDDDGDGDGDGDDSGHCWLKHSLGQRVAPQPLARFASWSAPIVGSGRTDTVGFPIGSQTRTLGDAKLRGSRGTREVLVHGLQTKLRAQRSTACFVPVGGGGRSLEAVHGLHATASLDLVLCILVGA